MKSDLRIFKGGVEIPLPSGSARFLDMDMATISEAGDFLRRLDGSAVSTSYDGMDRYDVTISCSDMRVPPIAGIRAGDTITVHATEILSELGPAVTLQRDPVEGSIVAYDANGAEIDRPSGRTLNVPGAAWFEYRPVLTLLVTGRSGRSKEGKAQVSWSISATESDAGESIAGPALEYVEATGGDEVFDYTDAYGRVRRVHKFTSTGSFDVTARGTVSALLVGGAGAGGYFNTNGGGGGAGGVPGFGKPIDFEIEVGTYTVEVGAGGAINSNNAAEGRYGYKGTDTNFCGLRAFGGGGGGGSNAASRGVRDGASGGGDGARATNSSFTPGTGVTGQGYEGGYGNDASPYAGGGGGGAGGPGFGSGHAETPSRGGDGIASDITGETLHYAAGGCGGADAYVAEPPEGGSASNVEGAVNSGSGGGAQAQGGSGVVIISYIVE